MERRLELKAARVRKGWTQLHLALAMGVSQQTVAKWERGHNAPATFAKLRRLENVLGVSKELMFPDIFGGGGGLEQGVDSGRSSRLA